MTDFPKMITLCYHHKCNQRCSFCCYVGSKQEKETPFHSEKLSREQAMKIIDMVAESDEKPFLLLGGASGEPTLYPHFLELAWYARSRGIHCSVTTNGTLLEPMLEDLVDMAYNEVRISINAASRKAYRQITGKDHFNTVVNNVDTLLKIRGDKLFPRVGVLMVHTAENADEVEPFVEIWKHKADYIRVSPAFINRQYENPKDMRDQVISPCKVGLHAMNIDHKGDVTFCCRTDRVMGNVFRDGGIRGVYHKAEYSGMRADLLNTSTDYIPEICSGCDSLFSGNGKSASAFSEIDDGEFIIRSYGPKTYYNRKDRLESWKRENWE